jgi:hypothetical protein
VHHNLVDGNVSGIVLSAAAKANRIVSNIVSRAGRNLVRSTLAPRTGRTNLVASNCLWHGFRGNVTGAVVKRGNVVASPRFVNRPVSLAVRPGPCFGKRPYATASLRRAAAISSPAAVRPPVRTTPRRPPRATRRPAPPPPPVTPPPPAQTQMVREFRVRYRLLALPRSVKVLALTAVHLSQSARVRVVCVQGCRADEPLRVASDGSAPISRFRGRRLGLGTVIEVRARRPGAVGHVARITIVGVPKGVRIEHGCLPPAGPAVFVPCSTYA